MSSSSRLWRARASRAQGHAHAGRGVARGRGDAHRTPAALRHGCPRESFAARELGRASAIVTPMIFRDRPVGFLVVTDRLRATGRSTTRTSGCCRRSRRARRRRSRPRRTRATRRCAAGSRRPSPSAPAGRASCTTRRCSSSAGCACCWPARGAAGTPTGCSGAIDERARADHDRDRRPALADHGAASGGAGRARHQAGARDAGRAVGATDGSRHRARGRPRLREWGRRAAHSGDRVDGATAWSRSAANVGQARPDAPRVEIVVSDRDGHVAVTVRDDGGVRTARRSAGFGLVGMRERVALVHGALDIESAPGSGTLDPSVDPAPPAPGSHPEQRRVA